MYGEKVKETQRMRRLSMPAVFCVFFMLAMVFLGCSGFDASGSQETEYTEPKTMWALDDVNVRETPTKDEDNIIYSLDKGQSVTVTGETPDWYEVSFSYVDENGNSLEFAGFLSKEFLSASEPDETSPAETAPSADAGAADQTPAADEQQTEAAADQNDTEVPASVASFMEQESVKAGTETVPLKGRSFQWTESGGEDAWEVMVYPDIEEGSEKDEKIKEGWYVAETGDAYIFLVEGGRAVSAVKMEAGDNGQARSSWPPGYYEQTYSRSDTEDGRRIFQLREGKAVQVTDLSSRADLISGMSYSPRIDGKNVTPREFAEISSKYSAFFSDPDEILVICFDPNGGEGETEFTWGPFDLDMIHLPDGSFTRDGAEFAGWGLTPDDSLPAQAGTDVEMKTIQSNIKDGVVTWYAIWR